MKTELDAPVQYFLPLSDESMPLNAMIGRTLSLVFNGRIHCVHCGRKISKSFNQGFCFPCFRSLAQCDMCIVKPEQCHFHEGTCREPDWALDYCIQPHIVYLANSSGIKVGITRHTQIPTRWIDQGAVQALAILQVEQRFHAGLIEVVLKQHVSDRTNWQRMLKGQTTEVDLIEKRDYLFDTCHQQIEEIQQRFGEGSIKKIDDHEPIMIEYPVEEYPTKIKSFNFDKHPCVSGTLLGIKGQYLIFDTGVINIRKFGGYEVELCC